MTGYTFTPNFSVCNTFNGLASIAELADEAGMYSATPDFIRKHGGPIANSILAAVPDWFYVEADRLGLFPNCDVRIHRLYPGDFPAYPGWHCDGEFRETYFSQPDLDRIPVSHHLIATVSNEPDGVSNTQFLTCPVSLDVQMPEHDKAGVLTATQHNLWAQVHRHVEAMLDEFDTKPLLDTMDGQLMHFDARTIHRAMPARVRGWRLFFRMSMWHKPNLGDGGKITKQEQVYKLASTEGYGW